MEWGEGRCSKAIKVVTKLKAMFQTSGGVIGLSGGPNEQQSLCLFTRMRGTATDFDDTCYKIHENALLLLSYL